MEASLDVSYTAITDKAIVDAVVKHPEDKEEDSTVGEIQEFEAGRDVAAKFAKEDGSYIVNYTPPVIQPYPSFGITALGPHEAL
ncbi:hypothetical protein CPC16_006167, partial [Podila verticillata]